MNICVPLDSRNNQRIEGRADYRWILRATRPSAMMRVVVADDSAGDGRPRLPPLCQVITRRKRLQITGLDNADSLDTSRLALTERDTPGTGHEERSKRRQYHGAAARTACIPAPAGSVTPPQHLRRTLDTTIVLDGRFPGDSRNVTIRTRTRRPQDFDTFLIFTWPRTHLVHRWLRNASPCRSHGF